MSFVTASIPGKIMLAGEYSVLQGGRCLALAVDQWLHASARYSRETCVQSTLWSETRRLADLKAETIASEPLLQAAQVAQQMWLPKRAFTLAVASELNVSDGLGSSSAVRLASLIALKVLSENTPIQLIDLARMARDMQLTQQSFASGYDLLVQSQGGLLLWNPDYKHWPGPWTQFSAQNLDSWIHVYVGGRGAPTGIVGQSVRQWLAKKPYPEQLDTVSEQLVDAFLSVLDRGWQDQRSLFLEKLRNHRNFFCEAPAYPQELLKTLSQVPGFDESWGFKTTGAGGEDAILLFGDKTALQAADRALQNLGWYSLKAGFTDQGARWNKEESS